MGAHVSGGLTPLLVTVLMDYVPWRMIFVMFGLVGFIWAAVWYAWFRDEPSEHPQVNEAERQLILAGRQEASTHEVGGEYWRRPATHPTVWALCVMYIANVCAYFFCITWLPTYLEEQHGLKAIQLGIFAGMPLTLSVLGDLFGGVTTDRLTRRFGLRIGRSGLGAVAYALSGVAMLAAAATAHPTACAAAVSLGGDRHVHPGRSMGDVYRYRRPALGRHQRDDEHGRKPVRHGGSPADDTAEGLVPDLERTAVRDERPVLCRRGLLVHDRPAPASVRVTRPAVTSFSPEPTATARLARSQRRRLAGDTHRPIACPAAPLPLAPG